MATALQAETRFSQMLQCPICLDTFERPKVLPCGHTYCATCLQSHINSKVTNKGTSQVCFPCPVCGADTPASNPNINIKKWAESLPMNNIISSLLDIHVGKKTRKSCEPCVMLGKESLATCFCTECDQSMCMTCKNYHDGFPALRPHGIINTSDGDDSCFLIPNMSNIEVCSRHSDERIKFFCADHKTVCCNTCFILDHRKCDKVVMIDDIHKSFDYTKISKEAESNLSKFEEHLKQITHKIRVNAENIQTEKTNIMLHLHSLIAQLIAKLQKLEGEFISSLESNCKSEHLNLQDQESRGQSLITAIHSDRTQVELVMFHGSEAQKFITLHNLDQNHSRYFRAISEYQQSIKEIKIRFIVDKTFQKFANTISDIGSVTLMCNDFDCSLCPGNSETIFQTVSVIVPVKTPLKEGEAVKVSEFNVKETGDTNACHITDILHLKDSRILLVDKMNSKIKMFGYDYTYQDKMTLVGGPWSACLLSDTEVAVTIPDRKQIQIIGISDKLSKIREIRTRLRCWGIAVVTDQLVITTYEDEHSILILNMNGEEIRTVRPNTYQTEKLLKPLYIKTDKTNSAICISNEIGHKLVSYNMIWNVLFTYMNQDITNATGVDIDREGNIYLCGYISQCVQQISAEGTFIKTLISKEIEKKSPLVIRFCDDRDRFIVTYGACDTAEVYDLCV